MLLKPLTSHVVQQQPKLAATAHFSDPEFWNLAWVDLADDNKVRVLSNEQCRQTCCLWSNCKLTCVQAFMHLFECSQLHAFQFIEKWNMPYAMPDARGRVAARQHVALSMTQHKSSACCLRQDHQV